MPTSKDNPTTHKQLSLQARAFAKINLGLNILGPRGDGFHDLQSVFCRIGWHDTLTFTLEIDKSTQIQLPQIQFTCDGPHAEMLAPEKPNLVTTAANAFLDAYLASYPNTGTPLLTIHLEKHIPVQAGLGGGSSDAAATLNALNGLFKQRFSGKALPENQLYDVAVQLGSDVPFFLADVDLAYVTGRGEHIQPLKTAAVSLPWSVIVAKPKHVNISTVQAYQTLREQNHYQTRDFAPFLAWLKQAAQTPPEELPPFLNTWLINDFETVILPRDPIFQDIKAAFSSLGAVYCMMSGSGPSMVGFFVGSFVGSKDSVLTQTAIDNAFQQNGLAHKTDYWVQEHS